MNIKKGLYLRSEKEACRCSLKILGVVRVLKFPLVRIIDGTKNAVR